MSSLFFSFFLIFAVSLNPFGTTSKEEKPRRTSLELPVIQEDPWIRVALLRGVSQVQVATDSPYTVWDGQGRTLFGGKSIASTAIRAGANGIQIGPQNFRREQIIISSEGEQSSGIRLGDKLYSNSLQIWREESGTLLVINELGLEEYLKGVLPKEMIYNWPIEALKAQAVASRTYALFNMLEKPESQFDVNRDVRSQVYGGKSAEKKQTNRAVAATRGEILTYQGEIFPAYFHSASGGTTTDAKEVWGVQAHPSLKGIRCEICGGTKHDRWSVEYTLGSIEKKLKARGIKVSGLRDIKPKGRDASGRVKSFLIVDAQGKQRIASNRFRLALGAMKLKSTFVDTVVVQNGKALFRGRGFGHGVGMPQYGAKKLAELGYDYKDILEYFYPGSQVRKI